MSLLDRNRDYRECTKCGATLVFDSARNVWVGDHLPDCPIRVAKDGGPYKRDIRPGTTPLTEPRAFSVEDVPGPSNAPLWKVIGARSVLGSPPVTDTFHVRAETESGALLLAREMHMDLYDLAAIQIQE